MGTQTQDAFAALPGLAHVKRAMEVAAAGGHSITIIDCNGYWAQYIEAYQALNPGVRPGLSNASMKRLKLIILKPCPCGNLTHPERVCECSSARIRQYRNTVKFRRALDADIVVDAGYIHARDFNTTRNEGADAVLGRIDAIAKVDPILTSDAEQLLGRAYFVFHMNAAERDRAVRVAVTIAGLDKSDVVEARHISEAIQYRLKANL